MMANLYLLLLISILGFVTNNSIEYLSLSSADSYSNSKSDQTESDSEPYSLSEDISQRLYKRQINSNENIRFSLSDIIENIEDSLLDSALGASNIYESLTSDTITKRDTDENLSIEKDIEHFVEKRNDDKNPKLPTFAEGLSSSSSSSEEKSNDKSDEKSNNAETIISHFTAREVPVSDDQRAHVALDRVTVYVANQGYLPMIPSFNLHHTGVQHESIKEILEDAKNSNSSEENNNNDSSNENVTTISTTSETINKNSSKKTAEELKEAEEELKEKVAEVVAEPIILSARV